jgi:hypothetical protein
MNRDFSPQSRFQANPNSLLCKHFRRHLSRLVKNPLVAHVFDPENAAKIALNLHVRIALSKILGVALWLAPRARDRE